MGGALRPIPARDVTGGRAASALARVVRLNLVDMDWRRASIAGSVSHALPMEMAVPALIEGLTAWTERTEEEGGGRRIQIELSDELRERTGRGFGPHPERWQGWWQDVVAGTIPLASVGEDQRPPTTAAFFGLRPATDRVIFVLDRSGSMDEPFGGEGPRTGPNSAPTRSRYREAVAQLLTYLTSLGPKAKFNVVLFADDARAWRSRLQSVSELNLKDVNRWLTSTRPNGGTELRAGVIRALDAREDGSVDVSKLEADTVVVLCDGQTLTGPGWIPGFLARANARIAFHAVQIGDQGDGTLERLAQLTGGQFVRIAD